MFGCSEDNLNLLIFFIVPYFPPNLVSSETRPVRFYDLSLGRRRPARPRGDCRFFFFFRSRRGSAEIYFIYFFHAPGDRQNSRNSKFLIGLTLHFFQKSIIPSFCLSVCLIQMRFQASRHPDIQPGVILCRIFSSFRWCMSQS